MITPSWLSGSWRSFLYSFSVYSCHLFLISSASVSEKSEATQSCLTLCDPMDCSLPGSFIHGIFQARVLEWVAISFSRGSSWPRDWTQVSLIESRCFTVWATREVPHSVLYCAHLCMKCSLVISNFLKEICNLSRSIIFLYFFALITILAQFSSSGFCNPQIYQRQW